MNTNIYLRVYSLLLFRILIHFNNIIKRKKRKLLKENFYNVAFHCKKKKNLWMSEAKRSGMKSFWFHVENIYIFQLPSSIFNFIFDWHFPSNNNIMYTQFTNTIRVYNLHFLVLFSLSLPPPASCYFLYTPKIYFITQTILLNRKAGNVSSSVPLYIHLWCQNKFFFPSLLFSFKSSLYCLWAGWHGMVRK